MKRPPYRVPANRKTRLDQAIQQEDPSLSPEVRAFRATCHALIRQHGWMVQAVVSPSGETAESYSYTVGALTNMGHPELLIAGLHPIPSMIILNGLLTRVREYGPLPLGERITDAFALSPVRGPMDAFAVDLADELYNPCVPIAISLEETPDRPMRVVQIYYPDNDGFFPHQVECATEVKAMQEMFPERGGGHGAFTRKG